MLYCSNCQMISEGDCPHCKRRAKKLRAAQANDPVLVFTSDLLRSTMVEPLLADSGIPYSKVGSLGAALAMVTGGGILEKFRFYVPYGAFERAVRLIAGTFGADPAIMRDVNTLGVDLEAEEGRVDDEKRVVDQYATPERLAIRRALHERFTIAEVPYSDWVLDHLDLKPEMRVLDIGCGSGDIWARRALPDGLSIVLADASEGMLQAAKEKTAGIANVKFEYALADACAMPFEDGEFDLILAAHMLFHVGDIRMAISEIARVMKPDGRLCATTTAARNLRELHDLADRCGIVLPSPGNGFTREDGENLLRDYFEEIDCPVHESSLQVTEAEPLVRYVQSYDTFGAQSPEAVDQLRAEIERKIEADGSFDITKLSCMFVCSAPLAPEMESEE